MAALLGQNASAAIAGVAKYAQPAAATIGTLAGPNAAGAVNQVAGQIQRMPTALGGPVAPPPAPQQMAPRVGTQGAPAGMQQQGMPTPGGNSQQMSPQAQAMVDAMRQRMALSQAQKMAADRGVFGGQQQGAQMPGLPPQASAMPPLFSGGQR